MTLRRKLLTTFVVLALLGLVVAGVSIWATVQWDRTNERVDDHYTRSLQVQRIRAATLEATREVPDALSDEDPDARQEFRDALEPVGRDFELWANLAKTDEERRQVRQVREAYDKITEDSERFFDLLNDGRREEAAKLADSKIEEGDFDDFEAAVETAVASDREYRQTVREQNEDTRRTAQLVLIIAAFGTVSLLLLVAAYLATDLFRPLRDVEDALKDVERGDLDRRLEEERSDELGAVSRAFNRMVAAIAERERSENLISGSMQEDDESEWRNTPSRVTLHRLVSQIRSRISQLGTDGANGASNGQQQDLVGQLDRLSQAVARVTEFGFPLDLNLARSDVRELLYEVVIRFQPELAERAVSLDLEIDPAVDYAIVDRLKLREALSELVRNALAALPERGGHLGLRARISEDEPELLVEVADDGVGAEQSLIDDAFDFPEEGDDENPHTGLILTKAIVEHHGGTLEIDSVPAEGTYVQIRLPLRS